MADAQAVGDLLERHRREHRLDHVRDPVIELLPLVQQRRIGQAQVRFHRLQFPALIFRARNIVGGALGVDDVMPGAVVEQRRALHGVAGQPEGTEEQMQDAGVVGIADVLHHQLPVVAEPLGVVAHDPERPVEHPVDEPRHPGAEIFLEVRRVVRKGAEHHPAPRRHPDGFQPVFFFVEVLGHAPLAVDAAAERDALEVAVQIERPIVVDAGEELLVAPVPEAQQRPAMGAPVDECPNLALAIAADDNRRGSDEVQLVIAGLGDFALQAQIVPGRPPKQALLLALEDFPAVENIVGNACQPFLGPSGFDCRRLPVHLADTLPSTTL